MTEATLARLERAGHIYQHLRNALAVVTGILITVVLVVGVVTLNKVAKVADDTHRNTDTLVNCTTPGHPCYEQARSATSGAVGTIGKVVTATAFCIKNLDHGASLIQIQACVTAAIK